MFAPKKILVPTDFSKFSDEALEKALDIARQYQSAVHLLHVIVVTKQCADYYCLDDATMQMIQKKTMEASRDLMEKQVRRVVKSKDIGITSNIVLGVPNEEILKEQKETRADLIVIASRGMSGPPEHILMGAIAEKVLRGARCPVLLV
ncbi:MAG TPA: universal stress protein [Syntrophorhabdaceae bacterium]|nr:universal stress protein [Syntrophorhabdaceae bacterium]